VHRYFKEYLRKLQTGQELTISVHCDVQIFELLLRLAAAQQQGELGSTDLLTLDNVLPVLISSSFLGVSPGGLTVEPVGIAVLATPTVSITAEKGVNSAHAQNMLLTHLT
jgi:hypothetical protein